MKNNVIIVSRIRCRSTMFGHHEGCVLKRYPVLFIIENYDQFSDFTGTHIHIYDFERADALYGHWNTEYTNIRIYEYTLYSRIHPTEREQKKKSYIHLSVRSVWPYFSITCVSNDKYSWKIITKRQMLPSYWKIIVIFLMLYLYRFAGLAPFVILYFTDCRNFCCILCFMLCVVCRQTE